MLLRCDSVIAASLQGREGDARLYDFRHSFAQRHADAGVPIDVLQQLMGHGTSDSTRHYYEVSRERRRQAVGVMRHFRFDRNGVLADAGQRELLDNEYRRAGLAGVAVPLGECSHPSMFRPGDQRRPVRYRCMGCPAFSTSVDRLPELRAYLDELLRSGESILASDLAEWAKQDALPMQARSTRSSACSCGPRSCWPSSPPTRRSPSTRPSPSTGPCGTRSDPER
ncbi:MAG: site-specific integrase [Actinomycetota bacterium]|nr:site-specific integrase [Actinomycetota bacterium]